MHTHLLILLAAFAQFGLSFAVSAAETNAAAIKSACATQYRAIAQTTAAADGMTAQEREATINEIIGDTLTSTDAELNKQAAPHAGDVWENFATCAAAKVVADKSGPLGLRNAPLLPSNGELHETAESGEDVLGRWRRQVATREGAPKHVPAKDATRCIGKTWKADNPASFEYGLVYNACDKPIQIAYCGVGVDCEANKGSIRTLQPGEASRYGDRDHKRIRAHACFGKIHPIGKLDAYTCE